MNRGTIRVINSKLLTLIGLIKKNYIIIAILLVGFFIRWYGIYFDYPYGINFIGDELYNIVFIINKIQEKNLFAGSSPYPTLLLFLYAPVLILRILYFALKEGIFSIDQLKGFLVSGGMGQVYILVRWCSVFFGTATIFLIYKIYKLIFKHKFSFYYASLVYAFSLIPVFLAHWGKVHSSMVFFLVLSLFFILKFERDKALKYFYWSLIFSACALSVHYIGISAVIFPFLGINCTVH